MMAVIEFNVSITPRETFDILNDDIDADLVYKEFKNVDKEKEFAVLVFEKYYFRSENRAALTVIIDNFDGVTSVRSIAAGSSQGFLFNFDWGAADNFAESIRKKLEQYII